MSVFNFEIATKDKQVSRQVEIPDDEIVTFLIGRSNQREASYHDGPMAFSDLGDTVLIPGLVVSVPFPIKSLYPLKIKSDEPSEFDLLMLKNGHWLGGVYGNVVLGNNHWYSGNDAIAGLEGAATVWNTKALVPMCSNATKYNGGAQEVAALTISELVNQPDPQDIYPIQDNVKAVPNWKRGTTTKLNRLTFPGKWDGNRLYRGKVSVGFSDGASFEFTADYLSRKIASELHGKIEPWYQALGARGVSQFGTNYNSLGKLGGK